MLPVHHFEMMNFGLAVFCDILKIARLRAAVPQLGTSTTTVSSGGGLLGTMCDFHDFGLT